MFDYAMFYRLVHSHISDQSDSILYICEDANFRKIFVYYHPDIERKYVITINDIWNRDGLRGLCYKDYKMIDTKKDAYKSV